MSRSNKFRIKLVGKLPETFKCPLCEELLDDPIQTFCGYRACSNCYEKKIAATNQCPFEEMREEQFTDKKHHFPDRFVVRDIMALKCYCYYKENGCTWEGEITDLDNHMEICGYYFVMCPACKTNVLEQDLSTHQENQCPQRMKTCSRCHQEYRVCREKEHDLQCEQTGRRCPFNCGETVLRKDLHAHVKECPSVLKNNVCPYKLVGCDHKIDDVAKHMHDDQNFHAALMIQQVESSNEKIDALNQQIHQQNEKYSSLIDTVSTQEVESQNRKAVILQNVIKESNDNYEHKSQRIDNNIATLEKKVNDFTQTISDPNILMKLQNAETVLKDMYEQYQQMENDVYSGENRAAAMADEEETAVPSISDKTREDLIKYAKTLESYENNYAILNASLSDIEVKLNALDQTTYDGKIMWRVKDVMYHTAQAKSGRMTTLHSPPSFTKRFGYKFCIRLYLNGDGEGKNTHVSLFFVVMRSDYDNLLEWPFNQRVTFKLVHPMDDSFSVRESFMPDIKSVSFQKPKKEMNIAAGCPQFIAKDDLHVRQFLIDDSIFIEAIVGDPSDKT